MTTRNMHCKGKSGKHKRIFTGRRNNKRKQVLNLEVGEDIVFEGKGTKVGEVSQYVGTVLSKQDTHSYVVRSSADETKQHVVTIQDHPTKIKDLVVNVDEIKKGDPVLVSWEIISGWVLLKPAQIVETVGKDYVWAKAQNLSSVKVHVDNIIKTFKETQELNQDLSTITVSHEEINVLRLMLQATQSQVTAVTATYHKTLDELNSKIKDSQVLTEQKEKLSGLYAKSLETTKEYRDQLLASSNLSQKMNTLQQIVTTHQENLDKQEAKITELDELVRKLKHEYAVQENEMNELREENEKLKEEVKQLKEQNIVHMRKEGNINHAKKIGSCTRSSSFIPILLPQHNTPSSKASRNTLKRRAQQLSQVLNIISARENPTPADLVQTLAAYLRANPDIALPACKSAKINFSTELSAKDAVDLKVLLRLPMTRMRDLRRFLSNFNIKVMPSDKKLYKEMKGRQYSSEETVEIGLMNLKKTSSSPETPIAFFRVRTLEEYIISHIEKQLVMENTWDHQHFNKELWIKIGGDKGGTSTKLAFQFVNQNNSNSADATNLISMFEATDSYTNMESVFSDLSSQIAELIAKKSIWINGTEHPLRILYFGDTEFLCKSFGHMGCASSYPCLWCHIQLQQLRNTNGQPHCNMKMGPDGKWAENANWPSKRTIESLQQDIANLLAEREDGNGARISGQDHHSMARQPIFPLPADVDHIVPPSLHILLGLVVRYFKRLEEECRTLDQGDLKDRNEQLFNVWQSASEAAKQAEVDLHDAKKDLVDEEDVLKGLEKPNRRCRGTSEPCSMPLCKLYAAKPNSINAQNIPWIQCIECGTDGESGWFHAFCVGLSQEESESDENDDFVCPVCTGAVACAKDVIDEQVRKVSIHKAIVTNKTDEFNRQSEALNEVYKRVEESRGGIERSLNDCLENTLGVKRQAYHSQCFVGNHCTKILSGSDVLLDVLPKSEKGLPVINRYKGLFGRLRRIFKYFKSEFLTEEEIKALRFRCWDLGVWFPKHFPNETIPPKLHILICHIPDFADKFKTIGLLSEHGIESIHKDVNAIERTYCTIRDKQERMRLVIANHQQRASACNNKAMQVSAEKKKTCYLRDSTGCKGRYKRTSDAQRTCQKCGHTINVLEDIANKTLN